MDGQGSARRSPLRLILAGALILAGLVWIGQGLGILTAGGGFMVGSSTWAVFGAVCLVAGIVLGWRSRSA